MVRHFIDAAICTKTNISTRMMAGQRSDGMRGADGDHLPNISGKNVADAAGADREGYLLTSPSQASSHNQCAVFCSAK
jgi:hypothetical protein